MPSQLYASRPGRNALFLRDVLCTATLSRDAGPTNGRQDRGACETAFALAPFPFSKVIFGTARSGQGRADFARRSEPLTARTVLEHGREGKGSTSYCDVQVQVDVTSAGVRYSSFLHKTAHAIRTNLFASATIATFWCVRTIS